MPEGFIGAGVFEDHLQQFNTAAFLSDWYSTTHDNRPHNFALRLRQNTLHFFTTLSVAQQTDFTLFVDAFRQNYTTNDDILKARFKAARQQPNQDIPFFVRCAHTCAKGLTCLPTLCRKNRLDQFYRSPQQLHPPEETKEQTSNG